MPDENGRTKTVTSTDTMKRVVPVVDHSIDSRDLFIATKEIIIAHRGDNYRLRLTAQNKLILTK